MKGILVIYRIMEMFIARGKLVGEVLVGMDIVVQIMGQIVSHVKFYRASWRIDMRKYGIE